MASWHSGGSLVKNSVPLKFKFYFYFVSLEYLNYTFITHLLNIFGLFLFRYYTTHVGNCWHASLLYLS